MLDEDAMVAAIRACLGEDAVKAVANKHRGGTSGAKGTRYEDFFLAVKVAEAAARQVDDPSAEWPYVKGQCYGFVDDARLATSTRTEYYQLKNKETVSWTSDKIAVDFQRQYTLSTHLKEATPTTGLVVTTEKLKKSLQGSMPSSIGAHSSVHYFPWPQTLNALVIQSPAIQGHLKKLANVEDPTLDVLSGVLGMLLMGCIEYPDGASVYDVVACACRMCPGQVRPFPASEDWERHFTAPFRQVLAGIQDLSYGAKRGYFHWSAFGTSGVFRTNCLSIEFKEFQELIAKHSPTTFEEFEALLP